MLAKCRKFGFRLCERPCLRSVRHCVPCLLTVFAAVVALQSRPALAQQSQTQPIACGQTIQGAITSPGQINRYAFSASAGVAVTVLALGQSFNAVADVYNPAGSHLVSGTNNFTGAAFLAGPGGNLLANRVNGVTSVDLTSTGTYRACVYPFYLGGVGSYGLSLDYTPLTPAFYRLALELANGAAMLTLWGQVGRSTTLQCSPGLPATGAWLQRTNFNLLWSPCQVVDWASMNAPQRFYQTVQ